MQIACLQMCSGIDQQNNADQFENMVRQAAASGAKYIQSPEMSGLVQKDKAALLADIATPGDTPLLKCAERLSDELKIIIHVGSCAVLRQDGALANRAFLFKPKSLMPVTYDKMHMFDAQIGAGDNWQESSVYEAGFEGVISALDDDFTLGFGICYDLRFPEIFRSLSQAGANLLSSPACFTVPTGKAHWQTLCAARAIENSAYMVCAAQAGSHEDGRQTFGHSLIVDPWGKVEMLDHDNIGILQANIDVSLVENARGKIPAWQKNVSFEVAQK